MTRYTCPWCHYNVRCEFVPKFCVQCANDMVIPVIPDVYYKYKLKCDLHPHCVLANGHKTYCQWYGKSGRMQYINAPFASFADID